MRPSRLRGTPRTIALLVAASLAVACASTSVPPKRSAGVDAKPEADEQSPAPAPPRADDKIAPPEADVRPEVDDRRLWQAARQAEGRILPPGTAYEERTFQEYVDQVATRLTPGDLAVSGEPVRVRVRKDPRLNAAALAHGTLVVHTGLIARAENEAQLAGVLAHEIAHLTHGHHVREAPVLEDRRRAPDAVGFLALLEATAVTVDQAKRGTYAIPGALAPSVTPLLTVGLTLSSTAMVSGYARDLEREADQEGMRLMASAGYDPREMAAMLRAMRDEAGERGGTEAFFWGSLPRLSERIETVERLAVRYPAGHASPIAAGIDFARRLQWVRVSNAQYDAYLGRVSLARAQMSKAADAASPSVRPVAEQVFQGLMWSSAAHGTRSRVLDEKLANEVMETAMTSLERALALAPPRSAVLADVYRVKGLMLYDWWHPGPERCQSKPALEWYLDLRPAAPDGDSIRTKLADLLGC
jgi:beta-barrel assembly-enhancing protease